jgi:hypothetical protein
MSRTASGAARSRRVGVRDERRLTAEWQWSEELVSNVREMEKATRAAVEIFP